LRYVADASARKTDAVSAAVAPPMKADTAGPDRRGLSAGEVNIPEGAKTGVYRVGTIARRKTSPHVGELRALTNG
jgi:hypothetical protein